MKNVTPPPTPFSVVLFFSGPPSTYLPKAVSLWLVLLLFSFSPVFAQTRPSSLISVGDKLFYTSFGSGQRTLSVTDGTAGGSQVIKEFPMENTGPENLVDVDGVLFFARNKSSTHYELWKSDGTETGTVKVKDIPLASVGEGKQRVGIVLAAAGNTLYFTGNNGAGTYTLWRSDGTPEGTIGLRSFESHIQNEYYDRGQRYVEYATPDFIGVDQTLYFAAGHNTGTGYELWSSDGTAAGTVLVKDIRPGAEGSSPADLVGAQGTLYFTADDGVHGRELWKSDGTAAGTVLIKDLLPGPGSPIIRNFTAVQENLFFTLQPTGFAPQELWRTDGTEGGTKLVENFSALGSLQTLRIQEAVAVGNELFFSTFAETTDDGHLSGAIWKSDGTAGGTLKLQSFGDEIFVVVPTNLVEVGGMLFFAGSSFRYNDEVWKSDGTAAGTRSVKDMGFGFNSFIHSFTSSNNVLYFLYEDDETYPPALWRSNGFAACTVPVQEYEPSAECEGQGGITEELWFEVPGNGVSAIPVHTLPAATAVLPSFESPRNIGDQYGRRIRGFVLPPQTGDYVFWIAGDNNSELWLSTDGNEANKRRIAGLRGFTGPQEWDKFDTQRSRPVRLEAGQKYYIEALQKEDQGNDHLAVAWQLPDGAREAPIPGHQLSPFVPAANIPPLIRLLQPEGGNTFTLGTYITIVAEATDLYGSVTTVEFYAGPTKIGEVQSEPFRLQWHDAPVGMHRLSAWATDNEGRKTKSASIQITVTEREAPGTACAATGTILREQWNGIPGHSVYDIPVHSAPSSTGLLTSLEGPTNIGDQYGSRIRGYICPPLSGNYTFFLSGDNNVNLYLSSDDDSGNKTLIAYLTGHTAPREWDKYPTQTSREINLRAGQRYYLEVLHKEEQGGDHVAVAWQLPSGELEAPITGTRLSPYEPAAVAGNSILGLRTGDLPASPALAAYPNPFTDRTTLSFRVEEAGPATLEVYDLNGRLVRRLFSGEAELGGQQQVEFDGRELSRGVYLARLVTGRQVLTKRIVLGN